MVKKIKLIPFQMNLNIISNGVAKLTHFIRSRRMKKVIVQQIARSQYFRESSTDDKAITFVLSLV